MVDADKPLNPVSSAELRVVGAETDDHTVSADILLRILNGLQRMAYLFAAADENVVFKERFKPSGELRQRYAIRCGALRAGSVALTLSLPAPQPMMDLFGTPQDVMGSLFDLYAAAQAASFERTQTLLPDPRLRSRALYELQETLPKQGERWSLGLTVEGRGEIISSTESTRTISEWLAKPQAPDAAMTVTGELQRVYYDQRKIAIRYPFDGRIIDCSYTGGSVEDMLYEVQHELVQVTGTCVLDSEGVPLRLTDVTSIHAVDLSPMTFERLRYDDRSLILTPPLTLTPHLDDESSQLYVMMDEPLGVHVYAQTRDQLVEELAGQLSFLWDAYALEAPERLTEPARRLAEELRVWCQIALLIGVNAVVGLDEGNDLSLGSLCGDGRM